MTAGPIAVDGSPPSGVRERLAPAKINLSLHVVGRRTDGYHLLDGLVAFAGDGDRLRLDPSPVDRLDVTGPFAAGVPAGPDNLVWKALVLARSLARRTGRIIGPQSVRIDKRLPVAAGIGGGSADAAALLRALADGDSELEAEFRRESVVLGADVPMCLAGQAARVSGIGDEISPLALAPLPVVLANPGVPVSTPAVFAALACRDNAPPPQVPQGGLATVDAALEYLARCRNDLEAPALTLAPPIAQALAALRAQGARLARMSGSGATVFAIFANSQSASQAAVALARAHPHWWVLATTAGGPAA